MAGCCSSSSSGNKKGQTKPYMVSISGKTLEDNLQMLEKISIAIQEQQKQKQQTNQGVVVEPQIAAVELNLACPNIVGKPTIGYDVEQMEDVLHRVSFLPCFGMNTTSNNSGRLNPPLFPRGVKLHPTLIDRISSWPRPFSTNTNTFSPTLPPSILLGMHLPWTIMQK